jgi:hypothetical protein
VVIYLASLLHHGLPVAPGICLAAIFRIRNLVGNDDRSAEEFTETTALEEKGG